MAKKPDEKQTVVSYAPGSPQLESLLSSGYAGMTREMAETIIKERRENPNLWSYERYEQAKAFLAALAAKPEVVSTDPGWKRPDDY